MALLLLLLGSCKAQSDKLVRAENYNSFWLWAGVRPQPLLSSARSLYLLEGEVTADEPVQFSPRLARAPHLRVGALWMVIRVETLDWPPEMAPAIVARLERWRAAGNNVAGLQVDFDARTRNLGSYAAFLAGLRQQLPSNTKLSITGLLDWSANGDPERLQQLSKTVDEVVIQTYQGRKTIPGYEAYFAKLKGFPIPFRVGLVQGGAWMEPSDLASHPRFQGYTVFLVNPAGRDVRH